MSDAFEEQLWRDKECSAWTAASGRARATFSETLCLFRARILQSRDHAVSRRLEQAADSVMVLERTEQAMCATGNVSDVKSTVRFL